MELKNNFNSTNSVLKETQRKGTARTNVPTQATKSNNSTRVRNLSSVYVHR